MTFLHRNQKGFKNNFKLNEDVHTKYHISMIVLENTPYLIELLHYGVFCKITKPNLDIL